MASITVTFNTTPTYVHLTEVTSCQSWPDAEMADMSVCRVQRNCQDLYVSCKKNMLFKNNHNTNCKTSMVPISLNIQAERRN